MSEFRHAIPNPHDRGRSTALPGAGDLVAATAGFSPALADVAATNHLVPEAIPEATEQSMQAELSELRYIARPFTIYGQPADEPVIGKDQWRAVAAVWEDIDADQRRVLLMRTWYNLSPLAVSRTLGVDYLSIARASMASEARLGISIDNLRREQYPEHAWSVPGKLPLTLYWRQLDTRPTSSLASDNIRFRRFTLGTSEVYIDGKMGTPTHTGLRCAILASLGLTNPEIASARIVSLNTVKTHLRRYFEKHGIDSRSQLPGHFLATRTFRPEQPIGPLPGNVQDLQIIESIAAGKSNQEIADNIGADSTVDDAKRIVKRLLSQYGASSREQLALLRVLSGKVDQTSTSDSSSVE
jgi:DNA-binding CsgD family transcriptional regulator